MQITNNFGLPELLRKAVEFDSHVTNGDISVSELISGPRVRILKQRHRHEITEDVSDRLYSLLGTCTHLAIERADMQSVRHNAFQIVIDALFEISRDAKQQPNKTAEAAKWLQNIMESLYPAQDDKYLKELTLSQKYGDMVLSGTFDYFDVKNGILWDYKLCSVHMFLHPEARRSWRAQTNIYAEMIMEMGYVVKEAKICAIFRDFDKHAGKRNPDYPQRAIMEIPVELQPREAIKKYILERVRIHKEAETAEELIPCTGAERWSSADTWAVMVEGGKRSVSPNHISLSSAEAWISENKFNFLKKRLYPQLRPGESKKCSFCSVREFCDQYKLLNKH
jgi:hypothetical protein